ncbi:hypothetical protein KSS87_016568 [Heliosperma pusillum]|nr:hypothetical protein KSS87_016568 [Heliosperma pusillum]
MGIIVGKLRRDLFVFWMNLGKALLQKVKLDASVMIAFVYGIGLLGGTVKYFAESEDTPKVLVCTHLTEIFQESVLPKSEKIMFYTMSVLRPEESSLPVEDIVFLYRLVPGQAHLSYGGCFTTC